MEGPRPPDSSGSLLRVRDSLTKRFQRAIHNRAKDSGMNYREFQNWVDELVGEGIAVALSRIDNWEREKCDFLHWAFLQTRDLMNKDLKKRNRRVSTTDYEEHYDHNRSKKTTRYDPENKLLVKERLRSVLQSLSPEQGQALAFRYLLGFPVKEMERLTGRSGVSIYSLLQRAKVKAREADSE